VRFNLPNVHYASLHKNDYWCIPQKEGAVFVACMEDTLDVYERPYNPKCPVVCLDEKPY